MPTLQEILNDSARYQIAATTAAIAAGAGTKIIFYARNSSSTKVALIEHVKISGHVATTAYAAGQVLYGLYIARAFTAEAGTTHGNALTLTGTPPRLKTGFPPTALGVIRLSDTTSGGMTAGTWNLDLNPIGQLNSHSSAGVNAATPIIGSQYLPNGGELFNARVADGEHPIVLEQNEGVVIQVTVPATGVAIHGVSMKWAEADRVAL